MRQPHHEVMPSVATYLQDIIAPKTAGVRAYLCREGIAIYVCIYAEWADVQPQMRVCSISHLALGIIICGQKACNAGMYLQCWSSLHAYSFP